MTNRQALGRAIRDIRNAKGLTQEDFSVVSSRTYLSSLERGLKSPTIDTLEVLAKRMEVHLLTIMTLAYMYEMKDQTVNDIHALIDDEICDIKSSVGDSE